MDLEEVIRRLQQENAVLRTRNTELYAQLRTALDRLAALEEKQHNSGENALTRFLTDVFISLRHRNLVLGIAELQAALQLVTAKGIGVDQGELKAQIQLIWCHSLSERQIFEDVWTTTSIPDPTLELPKEHGLSAGKSVPTPDDDSEDSKHLFSPPNEEPPVSFEENSRWEPLPVYAPFTPAPIAEQFELDSYWPISRRQMAYAWRYLRRPIADGPRDILDIAATIEDTTRQGMFFGPAYRRRVRNHVHLLLGPCAS
jgi:uncharacterized protein